MRAGLLLESRAALPRDLGWLAAGERERLAAMRVPRRRNEFRRGRWTAKRALARALGLPETFDSLAEIEICAGDRGAPYARRCGEPLACDLSISHRNGAALCAIGPPECLVGCDIEWVEPRSRAFALHFLSEDERGWLDDLSPAAHDEAANLLWSAKESAVKALRTGLDVDVRRLGVRVSPAAVGRLRVTIPGFHRPWSGRWGRHAGWLWTVVSPEPLPFEGPGMKGVGSAWCRAADTER